MSRPDAFALPLPSIDLGDLLLILAVEAKDAIAVAILGFGDLAGGDRVGGRRGA